MLDIQCLPLSLAVDLYVELFATAHECPSQNLSSQYIATVLAHSVIYNVHALEYEHWGSLGSITLHVSYDEVLIAYDI